MICSTLTSVKKTVIFACCAALLLFASPDPVRAEEEKEQEKKEEPARTFTNEDLEAFRPGAKPRPAAEPPAQVADPLKSWNDDAERRVWYEKQVRDLNAEVASIQARIDFWEKKKLSLRNPLYPRPTAPGEEPGAPSPEEEQDEGLDAVQRVEAADERIAALQKQLEATRARLARMEQEYRNPNPQPVPPEQPDRRKRPPVPQPNTSSPS